MEITGPANGLVEIEVSDDLVHWTSLTEDVELNGSGFGTYEDEEATNDHRFYRAKLWTNGNYYYLTFWR